MCGTRKCRFSLLSRTNLCAHIHCHVIVFIRRVSLRLTRGAVRSAGTSSTIRARTICCSSTRASARLLRAPFVVTRTCSIPLSWIIYARMEYSVTWMTTHEIFFTTSGRHSNHCCIAPSATGKRPTWHVSRSTLKNNTPKCLALGLPRQIKQLPRATKLYEIDSPSCSLLSLLSLDSTYSLMVTSYARRATHRRQTCACTSMPSR